MSKLIRHLQHYSRRLPAGDPYMATQRAADQVRLANERNAAKVRRAVQQASLPKAAPPVPVPSYPGIQQVWVTGVVR
jgi:hypothetical protein